MRFSSILFADRADILRDLSSGFQGEKSELHVSDVLMLGGVMCAVIIGFWLLSRLMAKESRKQGFNNPQELFKSLCNGHGLARSERSLLKQIARQKGLNPIARVFLEPDLFDTTKLPSSLQGRAARISALRQRLFAQEESVVQDVTSKT